LTAGPPPLTYAQALTMTRGEILKRVLVTQPFWLWSLVSGRDHVTSPRYQEFTKVTRLINPAEGLKDAVRTLKGEPGPSYWDQRPTPLEEDTHGPDDL
jgi:hypothetical protein